MINNSEMHRFVELSEAQLRQLSDAQAVLHNMQAAQHEAQAVRGAMRWRDVGGRRYLVRVRTRGAERSLGPHGDSTQAMFDVFHTRKAAAQARLSSMRTTLLKRSETRSLIAVLQRTGKTFKVRRDKLETAVNDAGFEIDVIRRMQAQGDPHSLRLSDDENDF